VAVCDHEIDVTKLMPEDFPAPTASNRTLDEAVTVAATDIAGVEVIAALAGTIT
jgi:hypothetical protein